MISEPHRLQYLDAMGLTAWVPCYQLPNAQPSDLCDWPDVSADQPLGKGADPILAPRERFQALLKTSSASEGVAKTPPQKEPAHDFGVVDPKPLDQPDAPVAQAQTQVEVGTQAHWQFSLQVGCVGGGWLVIVPSGEALSDVSLRLLGHLFAAAGVVLDRPPVLEGYRWPPLQNSVFQALSEDPEQDARDGLCAFLSGRQRMGWVPRQVLVFGMNDTIESLLASDEARSTTLDLPLWVGPELEVLATSAEEKRALWPRLADWQVSHD